MNSPLLKVKDVAAFLNLSTGLVYELVETGKLPGIKLGRVWRFEKEVIDNWIKSCYNRSGSKEASDERKVRHPSTKLVLPI